MSSRCSAVLLGMLLVFTAFADPPANFEKWEKEITQIEARTAKLADLKQPVVFVGSSSIRLWNLRESFPELMAVNHGFGGSHLADSVHFLDRLVLKFEPKIVVLYAGDNDLKGGKSPETVFKDFQAFVAGVHEKLPATKIIYIPIKPSPSRWNLIEQQKTANRLIREFMEKDSQRLVYLDIVAPMLGENGQPRAELFVKDMLHMNKEGYQVWSKLLAPHFASTSLK